MNLQENRRQSPNFRQIQLQQFWRFLLPVKYFGIFHGRLPYYAAFVIDPDGNRIEAVTFPEA